MYDNISPAGVLLKLVEEGNGIHDAVAIYQRASGGMTEKEYKLALRSLIRLGLITEVRRRCGGKTSYSLEHLKCQRTPFDDEDIAELTASLRPATSMEKTFGLDALAVSVESPDLPDAFWSHVKVGEDDACWDWTGSVHAKGYGRVKFGDKYVQAHRIAYQLASGQEVEGKVYHTCGNSLCCNPLHLSTVSPEKLVSPSAETPWETETASETSETPDNWPPYINTTNSTEEVVVDNNNPPTTTNLSEDINLNRIHRLGINPVSEKVEAPVVDREMCVVGWNTPPDYWPEKAKKYGKFQVFGQPAPFARPEDPMTNHYVLHPNVLIHMHDDYKYHYGYFVDTDGYVIGLYLDWDKAGKRIRAREKWSFDENRYKMAVADGKFDPWADYVGEKPAEVQLPTVLTPTGVAVQKDNSDIFASLPTTEDGTVVLPSTERDLNSGMAWAYAEEVIRRYRSQTPAKQWSQLIGPYPVPAWAEEEALLYAGKHYWELEVSIASLLEDLTGKPPEFRAVRAYVSQCLALETDPKIQAATWGSRISDPTAFLCSVAIKLGGSVPIQPTTARPVLIPVTPFGLDKPEVLEVGDHFPKVSAPSTSGPVVLRPRKW